MKKRIHTALVLALVTSSSVDAAIMSSEVRAEKLGAIRALVSADVVQVEDSLLSVAPSPFSPDLGIRSEEEPEMGTLALSDDELLEALSEHVSPTGIFMFGGEFYLIFKEKRLKVGSNLDVPFDGSDYSVTITEITGSTYRIRRGDAELQLKLK